MSQTNQTSDGIQGGGLRSEEISSALRGLVAYADFNYGRHHVITQACAAGNAANFMAATKWVTESSDIRLAGMQNKIICAGAA